MVSGVRLCEIFRGNKMPPLRGLRGRKKVFSRVMTYENPRRAVLMARPTDKLPRCEGSTSFWRHHQPSPASWQLQTRHQTVGLAISGLGPLTVCTKSGRCLESEAPIRYPSLKRPGLESGAALLIPDEKLLMRFKSWHLSPNVPCQRL